MADDFIMYVNIPPTNLFQIVVVEFYEGLVFVDILRLEICEGLVFDGIFRLDCDLILVTSNYKINKSIFAASLCLWSVVDCPNCKQSFVIVLRIHCEWMSFECFLVPCIASFYFHSVW